MKKAFFKLLLVFFSITVFLPLSAQNPWNGKVILQGFWWDYHNNNYTSGWSNYLSDLSPRLRNLGIDAVWIPPCVKNAGPGSNGYGPFDHYDLGDKFQKGNLKTRLGSKDELLRMIGVVHANGMDVIHDVVLNHMSDAGSSNGSGGQDPNATSMLTASGYKNFRYASFAKPVVNETAADYLARTGRWPKNYQNFYPNPSNPAYNTNDINTTLFGPDISYESTAFGLSTNATFNPAQGSDYMRTNARNWLVWLKKQTGADGVRLDASKHFPAWATQDFLWNLKYNAGWANGGGTMVAIGEYIGNAGELDNWINNVRTSNGGTEDLVGTFDFSLRNGIKAMVDGNGGFDLGSIPNYQQGNRTRTIPFVNNHDTFRPIKDANGNYIGWDTGNEIGGHIDPFNVRLSPAYAIAFAVDGSPQVFFEDLFNIGGTAKRYTHLPTSTVDLPIRGDIENIIWCHQKLNFKKGSYKVRWQAQDLLIIERGYKAGPENSYAIVGINDSWNTWQSANIQTDFGPNRQLKDYSGANTNNIWTDANGRVTIWVPPCDGSNVRRGYCIWGPVGITGGFAPAQRSTTQEWEMDNDLGDSHASSLQQGGALPASSTTPRTVGKVFAETGKAMTVNLYPSDATRNLTVTIHNAAGTTLATASGTGTLTLNYTPTATAFYTMKVKNTSATNPAQKCWVKVTYTSPQTANTIANPAGNRPANVVPEGPLVSADPLQPKMQIRSGEGMQTLQYSLAENDQIRLEVFDMNGKLVQNLVQGMVSEGTYNQVIRTANWAAGMYSVRLATSKGIITEKFVVTR